MMIGDWVLYKDNQVIVFNKPPGIPVQPDKTGDKSLLSLAEIYCKHPLFLVHRLDRSTSGIVLFAKKQSSAAYFSAQLQEGKINKTYLAIVGNLPPESEGTLVHFIEKDGRANRSKVSEATSENAREATMHYRVIAGSDRYHLLEIDLVTGRHHQARAQLSAIGSPIKGDVKYGFRRGNTDRSISLHAWKIAFKHPVSREMVHLTAPPPDDNLWKALLTVANIDL